MPFSVLLEPAQCASVNVPLLRAGEFTSLVLEQVQIDSEVGTVGLPGAKDIGGVTGSLHATTQRLIWLEDGASNPAGSRNVVRLAPAFKIKLRTRGDGCVSADGRELIKLTVTHSNLMAAFSTVNPVKSFVDQLSVQLRRQGGGAMPQQGTAGQGAVDHTALQNLEIMGFEQQRATCALLACDGNSQRAVQWLVEHQDVATSTLQQQAGTASTSGQATTARPAGAAPLELQQRLQDMGYTANAAAFAYQSTSSPELRPNVDWLLNNPPAEQPREAGNTGMQPNQYPTVDFASPVQPAAAIQSHPVGSGNLYGSHTPGYAGGESARNPLADRQAGAGAQQHSADAGAHRPVGMADLIHGRKAEAQQLSETVHSGFQDLETLRASGEKLAKLAADLRDRLSSRAAKPDNEPGSPRLDTALADSLVDLGIVNPVTKQSAGTQYHEQLARQLSQFLVPVLQRERGMLDMHDVYCLFNRRAPLQVCHVCISFRSVPGHHRSGAVFAITIEERNGYMWRFTCRARGLELVSPDDLRAAVEHFERLRLPVHFRQFPSGVAVVQDESWSDDAACERIVNLLDELEKPRSEASRNSSPGASEALDTDPAGSQAHGAGLRPMQFAVKASMPVAVAKEQLLLAERAGVLCRDDAPGGLAFYRNIFMSVTI